MIVVAGLTVGENNKHSDSETKTIISTLFSTNFTLLQSINETNNGTDIMSFNPPSNFVRMRTPSGSNETTDAKGRAVAKVPTGLTAIVDGSSKGIVELIDVTSGMGEVKLDTDSSGLSLSFASGNSKSTQPRTVELNQELHYVLKVNKKMLSPTALTKIVLRPDANIIIDETSVPNTVNSLIPPIINPGVTFDPLSSSDQLSKVAETIGQTLISSQINMYELTIPPTDSDVSIDIKAHLSPVVYLNDILIQQGTSTNTTKMNIPIQVSSSPDNNFGMTANVISQTTGTQITSSAPKVNTTGINFVEVDASKNKMVRDAVYVLGKTVGSKKYLYDSQGKWSQIQDLSAAVPTSYTLLRGGNQYVFGDNEVSPIELNNSRFNYDYERDTKINQSLIKLFGLGEGKDYFLYQVATPANYSVDKTPINFSIFSENIVSPNGSQLIKTSIKTAVNQSFKINGLIPDYSAGTNEYNVLAVTPQKEVHFSALKSIIFPLALFVLGILVIGGLLVRVV
ncbi:MAG: cell surface protein [Lactococcus lactis]|nr:cell surface protein [Lactococcus lactis]